MTKTAFAGSDAAYQTWKFVGEKLKQGAGCNMMDASLVWLVGQKKA